MKARAPQGGKVADPAWRRWRAQRAVAAAAKKRQANAAKLSAKYATKAAAYAAGDRNGYSRAVRWWKFQVKTGRVDASGRNTRKLAA